MSESTLMEPNSSTLEISSNLHELFEQLAGKNRVVIVSHLNPDGDAIGSMMALYHYLIQLKQQITIISPTAVPDYLSWVPCSDKIIDAEEKTDEAFSAVDKADLIFCLDFGVLSRAKILEGKIATARAGIINIDHHADYQNFAHYNFRDISASSTCELVYHFILTHSGKKRITQNIANCLYLGIMTDTGSFKYNSNSQTLRIAADLLEYGADSAMISHKIYNNNTENKTRLLGQVLSSCLYVLPEYNTAYIVISADDYANYDIKDGETEGIVTYALAIKNINLGIIFVERPDKIKMSFRSVGKFPANELAKLFNGGGHHNAAGGNSELSLSQTIEKLKIHLSEFKEKLDYIPFD